MTDTQRAHLVALNVIVERIRAEKGNAAAAAIHDQLMVSYSLIQSNPPAGGQKPH